jgi:hypothetical protein
MALGPENPPIYLSIYLSFYEAIRKLQNLTGKDTKGRCRVVPVTIATAHCTD